MSPAGAAGARRPAALHRRHRQAAGLLHAPRTPMSGVLGAAYQRPHDHCFDATIVNAARCARARLIVQPGHALLHKAPPPFAYRPALQAQLGCHFLILTAFCTGQHDPRCESQRLRRLSPRCQRLKFSALIIAQHQGRKPLRRHQILRRCCAASSLPQRCESNAILRLRTCDSGH